MTTPQSEDGVRAVASASAVQMSAALVHMSAFVSQLRCGQPMHRSALHVMRHLESLAGCRELAPPLRREFANLADAWSVWVTELRPAFRPQTPSSSTAFKPPPTPPPGARPRLRLVAVNRSAATAQPR